MNKNTNRLALYSQGNKHIVVTIDPTGVILGPFSLFGPTIANYEFVRFIK